MARSVGEAARINRVIRDRATNIIHIRMMRTDPEYARQYNTTQGLIRSATKASYLKTYFTNAFGTAESIYAPGNIRDNYKAGQQWDDLVH